MMPDLKIENRNLRYDDSGGTGPAVVFCHSFGMSGEMFAPQLEAFQAKYRCITWDARAHGGSPANNSFTFWDSAKDCLSLFDHLEIEQASFVGVSQGGFVVLRIALLAPARVRSLAILGSSATAEDPAQKVAFSQLNQAFIGDGISGPPQPVLDAIAHVCFGNRFDSTASMERWRKWPPEQANFGFHALADRDGVLDRLGEIRAPTLVLHGSADNSYPVAHAQAIAKAIPGAEGPVIVDGGAHFLSLTDPAAVNAALGPFLAHHA
jgi:3-oxoadipate enol-lactonase